jgi:hypothetical protein
VLCARLHLRKRLRINRAELDADVRGSTLRQNRHFESDGNVLITLVTICELCPIQVQVPVPSICMAYFTLRPHTSLLLVDSVLLKIKLNLKILDRDMRINV